MRKATVAILAIAGVVTPVAAAQAADANLVQDVITIARRTAHPQAPTSTAPATPAASSAGTGAAATTPELTLGSEGERVTALQRQLVAAGLMDHAPTGYYGELTERAVKGAQQRAGLPVTGRADEATLRAVAELPAAPRTTPAAQTTSAPKSSPSTSATPRTGGNAPSLDERCLTGRVMCVDKTRQRLYWVVDGQVIDDFSTRTGREGLATREGSFTVYRMEERSWSKEYHVYMPYSMYFSGGQAVHYSRDFARNGYGVGSHGCVNLRDYSGIAWLYSQVRLGDKVVVYRS